MIWLENSCNISSYFFLATVRWLYILEIQEKGDGYFLFWVLPALGPILWTGELFHTVVQGLTSPCPYNTHGRPTTREVSLIEGVCRTAFQQFSGRGANQRPCHTTCRQFDTPAVPGQRCHPRWQVRSGGSPAVGPVFLNTTSDTKTGRYVYNQLAQAKSC